jgi:hypothetical protein
MTSLTEQLAGTEIVLAWDHEDGPVWIELAAMAWLHEARDPLTGEWVKSGSDIHMFEGEQHKPGTGIHRYVVPPASRLIARTGHKNPADHPFWKAHPLSAQNIINAYDAADPGTREQGRHWYSDTHDLASAITNGNPETGGILLSTYSPRKSWPANMYQAMRSFKQGQAMGPKDGMMITGDMQKKAQRAIDGAGIDDLMKTAKTHSFGVLIKHGDDHPDDPYGHVVIDTHAVNVAAGGNIRGKEGEGAPIGDARQHEYVADFYRQAAQEISQREGKLMKPHELQAITWLVQKQVNEAQDAAEATALNKGRATMTRNAWKQWMAYAREHNVPLSVGISAPAEAFANTPGAELLMAVLNGTDPDSIGGQILRPFRG